MSANSAARVRKGFAPSGCVDQLCDQPDKDLVKFLNDESRNALGTEQSLSELRHDLLVSAKVLTRFLDCG